MSKADIRSLLHCAFAECKKEGRQLLVLMYSPESGIDVMYSESKDPRVAGAMIRQAMEELNARGQATTD